MFRDLQEYQEIAKIYAEKVSKPEDLDEMRVRGGGVKTSGVPAPKPVTPPQGGAGGGVGNPTNVRGSGARNNRPKPEIKKFPTTAEIRAANPNVVPGTRTNEVGAEGGGKPSSGDLSMFNDKKPKSKFIKREKGKVGFVKRGTVGARRAENQEKAKLRAQAMAKARIAAKKKAEMSESVDLTPYDIVLEYLLSTEQAATIEEANYVMTEMDAETIQGIVEAQKKTLTEKPDDGYIGPKFLGIKTIGQRRKEFQLDSNLKRLSKTGDSPDARTMLNIPLDYEITPEQKEKYGFK